MSTRETRREHAQSGAESQPHPTRRVGGGTLLLTLLAAVLLLPGWTLTPTTLRQDEALSKQRRTTADPVAVAPLKTLQAHAPSKPVRRTSPESLSAAPEDCTEQLMLAPAPVAGDLFGWDVSLSGGVGVAVSLRDFNGVTRPSVAQVLRYDGGTWTSEAELTGSDTVATDFFGGSVSNFGDVVLASAIGDDDAGLESGSAYVFRYDGSGWYEEAKLLASDARPNHGFGLNVSVWGDVGLVCARSDESGTESGAAYVFRHAGGAWTEEAKLVAADASPDDRFGANGSVWGDVVLIGAPGHDAGGTDAGAAYVFRYDGSRWTEEATLVAGDPDEASQFGTVTALFGDVAVVGAPSDPSASADSAGVYVFRYDGSSWTQEAKLVSESGWTDGFGTGLSISGDLLLVGARSDRDQGEGSGAAYLFRFDGTTWHEETKLVPASGAAGDQFGRSLALSGDVALVSSYYDDDGGTDSGSVSFFHCVPERCNREVAVLTEEDPSPEQYFGESVSISGDVALVGVVGDDEGGFQSGAAKIFRYDGTTWQLEAKLVAADPAEEDFLGFAVSVSGDVAIVGAFGDDDFPDESGSAYIYRYDGDSWTQEAKLLGAPTDQQFFGLSVSLSGDVALVGAMGDIDSGRYSGAAHVFRWDGATWTHEAKLTAADAEEGDQLGRSVAVSGDVALVGASADVVGGLLAGSASVFRYDGSAWLEEAKLIASDAGPGDRFGMNAALSGDVALVGAPFSGGAGAAYIYRYNGTSWREEAKLTAPVPGLGDEFGGSVAVWGEVAVVGALFEDGGATDTGAAYVYRHDGFNWQLEARILPSGAAEDDLFGHAVAVSGDIALFSLDVDDDIGDSAGSVLVYRLDPCPSNAVPLCDAGPDIESQCDGVRLMGLATDPDGDPLDVLWSSSCVDTTFLPGPDVLDPLVMVGSSCDITCTLTLSVDDGQGGTCLDEVVVHVDDNIRPEISGVPTNAMAECHEVPPPPAVTASDNCAPLPSLSFRETRTDGECPDAYQLTRTWTAVDDCGNESTAVQLVDVVDVSAPIALGALEAVAPPGTALLPRSPRAPSSLRSACSPPNSRHFVVVCSSSDNCDPSPEVSAAIRATSQGVTAAGECDSIVDLIEVTCGEVVELRLVAAACPARAPRSARPALSIISGTKVISGESLVLELTARDRCGNTAVHLYDPTESPSAACEDARDSGACEADPADPFEPLPPGCEDLLDDGTCCPAVAPAAPPRCRLTPCGS